MELLSFVIPIYNSEKTISETVVRILSAAKKFKADYSTEIILIDDGSRDNSFDVCTTLAKKFPEEVHAYKLVRNFGQACALMAGLNLVKGNYVICLDDDLQTPPEEFPILLNTMLENGYDLVYGYYPEKKHSRFRNFGAQINQTMQNRVLKTPRELHTSSYFVTRKEIVNEVIRYKQPYPYLPGLFYRVTHKMCSIPIQHFARQEGRSGYTLRKLLKLWSDGFFNFSVFPLRLITLTGFSLIVFSIIEAISGLFLNCIYPRTGNTMFAIIFIILLIGGVQLLSIGVLGEYIGRLFMGSNATPQYVIKEQRADQNDSEKLRELV